MNAAAVEGTILDTIAASARRRVEKAKAALPLEILQERVKQNAPAQRAALPYPFENALSSPGISFICEVKKASPSKGLIAGDFPYLQIAREYEEAGAAAVSVLTEPEYFLGSDTYLREISAVVKVPTLRKDFTVDIYQIYEAKLLGAEAVLLICGLLDTSTLRTFIECAHSLGLSALVETHSEDEVKSALDAGARIIGVNNRNLKTFQVDTGLSLRLRPLVPAGVVFVSESGIRTAEDVRLLAEANVDAILIGETLMRAEDKAAALAELRGLAS
ncbi:indole-3-glycerol phosphate synthase [Spirochaetia bacterium]|nr:indole-3-glycerol phosphate synthase [Spirochaetia bacterium]